MSQVQYKSCVTPRCRKRKDLDKDGKCPNCVKALAKFKDSAQTPIWPCGVCNAECTDTVKAVDCDYCNIWFHIACVDIDDETYKMLMKTGSPLKWFCKDCDSRIEELFEKSKSLEKQTKVLQESMERVEKRLENVEAKVTGTVHKEINTAINERADIERRKMNLVIYNLPEEPKDTDSAWDTPAEVENDIQYISSIIEKELRVTMSEKGTAKLINARRLGKKKTNSDSGKDNGKTKINPRPLKITFSDLTTKREVLKRSKDLRNSDDTICRRIFVNPDLTEAQRANDKKLREEMWKIRETEQKNVIIRKGEIVEVTWTVRKHRANYSNKLTSNNEVEAPVKEKIVSLPVEPSDTATPTATTSENGNL